MEKKELLKYLTGINESLTEDEIGKRFSILRDNPVWDKLSDEAILKMAMLYRESDLPIHVVEILKEFGAKLLLNEMDLLEDFTKRRFIRLFEVFPNEGIRAIKGFFDEFNESFSEAVKDISAKRKHEKLQNLKNVLDFLQTYPFNEVINLELNKHKPYIKDYINYVEVEFEKKNKENLQQHKLIAYAFLRGENQPTYKEYAERHGLKHDSVKTYNSRFAKKELNSKIIELQNEIRQFLNENGYFHGLEVFNKEPYLTSLIRN
jgi:hypothetical protein